MNSISVKVISITNLEHAFSFWKLVLLLIRLDSVWCLKNIKYSSGDSLGLGERPYILWSSYYFFVMSVFVIFYICIEFSFFDNYFIINREIIARSVWAIGKHVEISHEWTAPADFHWGSRTEEIIQMFTNNTRFNININRFNLIGYTQRLTSRVTLRTIINL